MRCRNARVPKVPGVPKVPRVLMPKVRKVRVPKVRVPKVRVLVLVLTTAVTIVAAQDRYADVTITPLIHSSVQLEHAGKVIQVDPWSQGDLSRMKPADLILVTDDVNHHLDLKAIEKVRKSGAPVVIAANGLKQVPDGIVMANGDVKEIAGFRIEATPAYDVSPGVSFHPKGEANGYIITIGGQRMYIVGVTECVPEIYAAKNIDVAFFPLNLPANRMEAAAAVACIRLMKPKVVYPYHYDQDWVLQLNRTGKRGTATTKGLKELHDALRAEGIEVRVANWYPQ